MAKILKLNSRNIQFRDIADSFGDYIENPDKILRDLGHSDAFDSDPYEALLTDPHVYSVSEYRKNGTLSKKWDIEQNESDTKYYDLIWEYFQNIDVRELSSAILNAPLLGYQPIELIWSLYDNFALPMTINSHDRNWFRFDKEGELIYIDPNGNIENLVKYQWLLPRHGATFKNPYGSALLSRCWWSVTFKKNNKKYWQVFIEKYGMPWLTSKVGMSNSVDKEGNLNQDFINSFRDMLLDQVNDGVVVYTGDDDSGLTFQQNNSKSSSEIFKEGIITDQEDITKVILGHTAANQSTAGKLGNENMAESATRNVFESDQMLVLKTMNTLIDYIYKVNQLPGEKPRFIYEEEVSLNNERAERDKKLYEMGVRFSEQYYINNYNLEEGDFIVKKEVVDTQADKNSEKETVKQDEGGDEVEVEEGIENFLNNVTGYKASEIFSNLIKAGREDNTEDQQTVDEFADHLRDHKDNKKFFGGMIDTIVEEANNYSSLEDLRDNYYKIYKKLNAKDLNKRYLSGAFASWVHGLHSVNVETSQDDSAQNAITNTAQEGHINLADLIFALDKSPEDIVEFFRSKEIDISDNWEDAAEKIRKHIFTVSGVNRMDILRDFKELILEAIEDGRTMKQFTDDLKKRLSQKGWLETKEGQRVTPPWRLETIYRTNLQEAYQDGRWDKQLDTEDAIPYVKMSSIVDASTTKECKALDGKVFKKSDKYMQKYLRPGGHYNCRRRLISYTEFRLNQEGLSVSKGTDYKNHKNRKGFIKGVEYTPDESKYDKKLFKEYERVG